MPRRVDPDQRRRHIIDAALRLVVSDGLQAATFRRVAAEAALNIGSVRHYFADHESLIIAVVTDAGARMGRRLTAHAVPDSIDTEAQREHLLAVLQELVPLDEERRREAVILLEVIAASRITPTFRDVTAGMAADLHSVLTEALSALQVQDPNLEARRLASLVSGLSLDAVTAHGRLSPKVIRQVLRHHVARL